MIEKGDHLYETQISQKLEAANHGKIVAINIETEALEIADKAIAEIA